MNRNRLFLFSKVGKEYKMSELEEFKRNRADAYRLAFWCLLRKFHMNELSDILDELASCCKICDLDTEQTEKILEETIDSFLKQKGLK